MEGWTGKPTSIQSKIYLATFAVGIIAEFIGEVVLYKTIPEDRDNLKARFWARYAIGTGLAVVFGSLGYIAVEVLSVNGWSKTAWLFALLPMTSFAITAFVLQGVNTVLDKTSGANCVSVVGSAICETKKSVCK